MRKTKNGNMRITKNSNTRITKNGNECRNDNPLEQKRMEQASTKVTTSDPARGDHVFGDVVKAIETGLENIFRGGQDWMSRMNQYNPELKRAWDNLKERKKNLGHGDRADDVVVLRSKAETDTHAYIYGQHTLQFQWDLCEIVCVDNDYDGYPVIAGATDNWKNIVMSDFQNVMNFVVDETSLCHYINQLKTKEKIL
jgi:hypothetical protein